MFIFPNGYTSLEELKMDHFWHEEKNLRKLHLEEAKKFWLYQTEHHSYWLEHVNDNRGKHDCWQCLILEINWHLTMQDIRANK
jgi:hypothetical protein